MNEKEFKKEVEKQNYENNDFEGFTDDICNTRQLLERIYKSFDRNIKGISDNKEINGALKAIASIIILDAIQDLKAIERLYEI